MHEQKGFVEGTATSLSVNVKTVAAVAAGISRSMRVARKDQAVHLTASLTVELEHCATVYCGAVKTSDDVFEEATDFIFSQFGHLGVFEVRESFRLAAAGVLGDIDLKSYYGTFTIVTLGVVLRAYDQYRSNIVKEIRRREILLLSAQREAEKQVSWNTVAWEADRRERLLALEGPSVEHITAYDFDWLSRAGELDPTKEEKEAAWLEARNIVIKDYQAIGLTNRSFRRALEDVLAGDGNDGFYARRVATMKRLLVVGWIEKRKVESDKG